MSFDLKIPPDARTVNPGQAVTYHSVERSPLARERQLSPPERRPRAELPAIGSVVRLKSGSPAMTIESIGTGSGDWQDATCVWLQQDGAHHIRREEKFRLETLEPVTLADPEPLRPILDAHTARASWANAVMSLTSEERTEELRAMLCAARDAVDHGSMDERRLADAQEAFDAGRRRDRVVEPVEPPETPHPHDQKCSRCDARLVFSSRRRGDGMCGPCSRAEMVIPGTPQCCGRPIREGETCPCCLNRRGETGREPGAAGIHHAAWLDSVDRKLAHECDMRQDTEARLSVRMAEMETKLVELQNRIESAEYLAQRSKS